jgi:hypothetical protein
VVPVTIAVISAVDPVQRVSPLADAVTATEEDPTVTFMEAEEVPQTPEIVQVSVFTPGPKLFAGESLSLMSSILAEPLVTVHVPVSPVVAGSFPVRVICPEQIFLSPAVVAGTIAGCLVMTSVSEEEVQLPLSTLHLKVSVPTGMFVTVVLAEAGLVMVPVPLTTAQLPVPTEGVVADMLVLSAHKVV